MIGLQREKSHVKYKWRVRTQKQTTLKEISTSSHRCFTLVISVFLSIYLPLAHTHSLLHWKIHQLCVPRSNWTIYNEMVNIYTKYHSIYCYTGWVKHFLTTQHNRMSHFIGNCLQMLRNKLLLWNYSESRSILAGICWFPSIDYCDAILNENYPINN